MKRRSSCLATRGLRASVTARGLDVKRWRQGRETLAFHFQSRAAELFGVDIHPAARIGTGVMLDHASGITIGETAVVGDGCSLLHGVTRMTSGQRYSLIVFLGHEPPVQRRIDPRTGEWTRVVLEP